MELNASLTLILPEIVMAISAMALILITAYVGDKTARLVSILAAATLGAAAVMVAPALTSGASGPDTVAFGGQFLADSFASFAKILIYLSAIGCLMIAPAFFDRLKAMRPEYPVLVLLATLGMSIMVSAGDLITLYIGLELNSLAAYVLASFLRNDTRSAEAGLKYFVLGALASGILLYGMSLVYGFTGTTDFEGVRGALTGDMSTGALFGVIFVLAGLAFKIAAVPFHMWTPDVYEGAPTPVTTFFATAPKVAAVALTARVALSPFGEQTEAWQQIVIFAALASIVLGALGAIGQTNLKRLLAYSSINNVGFILIGLAASTVAGLSAMLTYLAIYVVMALGSFVALLMLKDEDGTPLETFDDIAGLSTTRPALAWCLLFLMFSLAGIPPLLGFWGKFVVFQAAVQADMVLLAALGIAASVIGAFYYIKFVKVMFFDDAVDRVKGTSDTAHWVLLILAAVVVSPLGYLLTGWLGGLTDSAASALFIAS
ncbi:NADH-quinone oxidoreductase subunit NuoN [Erythrobacter litoralis]|uniref:NADH-quinone oxidoreductase subunit N n=1 Tax=Erythrobacter litoralis (strain HTCC2594) TaxID=314225 RepID=NUON_ERYLH|nr:NADH-quinone oxidoreductase subunit NuoN [Erythrobacter litoralis]Q2NA79.1 RecName: Full=NADH-quinone oxidoreductase subunit N; AltName: Full=NADH dehydrogenase I subunit N; AltName: Full=NDH-1 subunit N [Erythrobacter litoralis HTCC2594]ABC63412.1 NuoN, NADH dehydrogenase I, N subunit [Erythrobacter litoralis HTCC2594]